MVRDLGAYSIFNKVLRIVRELSMVAFSDFCVQDTLAILGLTNPYRGPWAFEGFPHDGFFERVMMALAPRRLRWLTVHGFRTLLELFLTICSETCAATCPVYVYKQVLLWHVWVARPDQGTTGKPGQPGQLAKSARLASLARPGSPRWKFCL